MANRQERRALNRYAKSQRGGGAVQVRKGVEPCIICTYLVQHIGSKALDFKDTATGELIELVVNERLQPPLGLRWPLAAEKRPKCLKCAGVGLLGCPECKGSGLQPVKVIQGPEAPCQTCGGKGKVACTKCAGAGLVFQKTDYSPTCQLCSSFILAWINERGQLHRQKHEALSRILLPTQHPAQGTGKIILG